MLKTIILSQIFTIYKIFVINKLFIANKVDNIKDNNKLIKKFIEIKIRKLFKLKKLKSKKLSKF